MGKRNVVWNDYISQNERFADFFNGVVFRGRQIVRPEYLTDLDTKLWRRRQEKNSYHEYIRDTVKLWEYEDKRYVLALEPEDSPHSVLPVKYMNYESLEYDKQYKKILNHHRKKRDLPSHEYLSGFKESDRLMPVITIGIYLGERPWFGFTQLSEMTGMEEIPLEIQEDVASFCNEFRVNLLDIHALETSDIFQTDLREVFGFLKCQGDKEKLRQYVEENEAFRHMKEDAFDVLCLYGESRELVIRKEEYQTKEGMNMCTALRELKEEGRQEGRAEVRAEMCTALRELKEEGREEGRQEGRELERAAINKLNILLVNEGKIEDLCRASQDSDYQDKLLKEYKIKS